MNLNFPKTIKKKKKAPSCVSREELSNSSDLSSRRRAEI